MRRWFGYDGFVGWPAKNVAYDRIVAEHEKGGSAGGEQSLKSAAEAEESRAYDDLALEPPKIPRVFAARRRGRLARVDAAQLARRISLRRQDAEHPGHPPIDVDSISAVDRKLWDPKGIAFVEYAGPGSVVGRARLDDFIYERGPTDAIYKLIVSQFEEPAPETTNTDA